MGTVYTEFDPTNAIPAAIAGFATLTVVSSSGTGNPQRPKLLFDDAEEELAHFQFVASEYGSGNISVDVYWGMASATSGNVVLGSRVNALTPGDSQDWDADGFSTQATQTVAVPGTAGHLKKTTITITAVDSVAADDICCLEVSRLGDNGSDTASGDLEIDHVVIRYSD